MMLGCCGHCCRTGRRFLSIVKGEMVFFSDCVSVSSLWGVVLCNAVFLCGAFLCVYFVVVFVSGFAVTCGFQGRKQQSVHVCFMDSLSHQWSLHEELKLTNTRGPVKCAQWTRWRKCWLSCLDSLYIFIQCKKKNKCFSEWSCRHPTLIQTINQSKHCCLVDTVITLGANLLA